MATCWLPPQPTSPTALSRSPAPHHHLCSLRGCALAVVSEFSKTRSHTWSALCSEPPTASSLLGMNTETPLEVSATRPAGALPNPACCHPLTCCSAVATPAALPVSFRTWHPVLLPDL